MAPSLEPLELLEKPAATLPVKAIGNGASPKYDSPEKHQRVMNVFRAFIADLAQQYGEGHAG